MSEKLLNTFLSAAIGAGTALAGVWLLQDPGKNPKPESPDAGQAPVSRFDELEVERLKVTGGIWVCHSETGEPLIELKDGVVLAKNEVLARYVGGMEMVGRKLQITTGDPSAEDPPIFCELGASDGGQGAYIALLSPQGTHSVNVGFDRNETGFIVSRNNDDASMTAQVVLPLPQRESAIVPGPPPNAEPEEEAAPESASEEKQVSETPSEQEEGALSAAASPAPSERIALAPAESGSDENRVPGGLPMLTPSKPK